MLNQSLDTTHPDFLLDVQGFRAVLTAHMDEFIAGRHPDASEISKYLEALVSKGCSPEQIGAIKQEATLSIVKAVMQRLDNAVEAWNRAAAPHRKRYESTDRISK